MKKTLNVPCLYIDVGGSYTKIADDKQLASDQSIRIKNNDLNQHKLDSLAKKHHWNNNMFCLMSIGNQITINKIIKWLKKNEYAYKIAQLEDDHLKKYFAWKHVAKGGTDLFLATYYLIKTFKQWENMILISFGTSTALVLIEKKQIQGFSFIPSWYIAGNALVARAYLLEKQPFSFSSTRWGRNTEESLNSGVINSHWYAIQSYVKNYETTHNKKFHVIISGGGREPFLDVANKANYVIMNNIVLKGLAIYYKEQHKHKL